VHREATGTGADEWAAISAARLAERFGKAKPACIGAEQTAYLPGMDIEDGAFYTQLVTANLSLLGQRGVVVLLDIAKNFDTIDSAIRLANIERCGGGPGMRRWVRQLLQQTLASMVVHRRAAA
jgi:hypothetical protein